MAEREGWSRYRSSLLRSQTRLVGISRVRIRRLGRSASIFSCIPLGDVMAEREGFEPSKGYYPLPVFKTGAFNRSATSPTRRILSGLNPLGKSFRTFINKNLA